MKDKKHIKSFPDWCKEVMGIGDVNNSDMADEMTLETLKWDYLSRAWDAGYAAAKLKINI